MNAPVNTPEQEIAISQQDVNEANVRLNNFLNYYWLWHETTPEQIAAYNAVTLAIDEVVAKMEILKEALK